MNNKTKYVKTKPRLFKAVRHTAKLTPDQVVEIRRLWQTTDITLRQLGKDYGVSPSTTSKIVKREIWDHI